MSSSKNVIHELLDALEQEVRLRPCVAQGNCNCPTHRFAAIKQMLLDAVGKLEKDAARWQYAVNNYSWLRHEERHYLAVHVPYGANLSSKGAVRDIIDHAVVHGPGPLEPCYGCLIKLPLSESGDHIEHGHVMMKCTGVKPV